MDTHVDLAKLRSISLAAAVVGLIACAVGLTLDKDAFAVSWLIGWTYWFYPTLGALGWLMIYHLTSGRWGYVMQRPLEAAARLMPLMLILFIPVLFSTHSLYEWTHEHAIATDKLIQHKISYLNTGGYTKRMFVYFAVWIALAFVISGISRRDDANNNPDAVKRMRFYAAPGLVAFALAATFASFDWLMSLEPHWFSSIYGAIFMVAGGLSCMLFMAVLLNSLSSREPLKGVITAQQFHDIGNWCFAFTILWTYMNFSQFIIIWSGNLYEETFWYLHRSKGGWVEVVTIMALALFAIPFVLLLFKANKRNPAVLAKIALPVLMFRVLEVYWLIGPTFRKEALAVHWMDLAALVGIGGLWLFMFTLGLNKVPFLSGDARFQEFAKGEAGH